MDFSERLQKSHLTDLITFMKAKKMNTRIQDEGPDGNNFIENSLFHGTMPHEEIEPVKKSTRCKPVERVFDFKLCPLEDLSQFQYGAVWSSQMLK